MWEKEFVLHRENTESMPGRERLCARPVMSTRGEGAEERWRKRAKYIFLLPGLGGGALRRRLGQVTFLVSY